jgi:hypothetical protein
MRPWPESGLGQRPSGGDRVSDLLISMRGSSAISIHWSIKRAKITHVRYGIPNLQRRTSRGGCRGVAEAHWSRPGTCWPLPIVCRLRPTESEWSRILSGEAKSADLLSCSERHYNGYVQYITSCLIFFLCDDTSNYLRRINTNHINTNTYKHHKLRNRKKINSVLIFDSSQNDDSITFLSLRFIYIFVSLKRLYHKEDNYLLIFCVFSWGRSSNISQKYTLGNSWEYSQTSIYVLLSLRTFDLRTVFFLRFTRYTYSNSIYVLRFTYSNSIYVLRVH